MAKRGEREEEASVTSNLSFSINVENLHEFESRIQHVMSLIDDLNRRAASCQKAVEQALGAIDKIGFTVAGPKPAGSA
jgi:hypothetical protein